MRRLAALSLALCALLTAAAARAEDKSLFSTGCTDGKTFENGLCYDRCAAGEAPVGPVCWSACPAGYHDSGAVCGKGGQTQAKKSYGRGVGHVLGCTGGEEMDAGLCYPACRAGFHGVGPLCWQVCPSGKHDFGAFCNASAKKTYGRGVGKAIHGCSAGLEKDGALCYQGCKPGYRGTGPVCWEACPAGFNDAGALCFKPVSEVAKRSHGRGAGTIPPLCSSESFTKAVPAVAGPAKFTMIFASDTQLPWWQQSPPACNGSDACVREQGLRTNREQVAAMNAIERLNSGKWPTAGLSIGGGRPISRPVGVVINGDLTAYFHPDQVDLFEELYNNKQSLKLPLFLGLGNHDDANNNPATGGKDQGCWWSRDPDRLVRGVYGCSHAALGFARSMVACNKVPAFPAALVQSFDNGSAAYSWNIGRWHFVQLHNRPDHEESHIGLTTSFAWLKKDVQAATAAGRNIVLNMHDYGEHMKQDDKRFLDAIASAHVVAIFAGHIHQQSGYVGDVPDGRGIPVFRSGASEHQTFLLAEFDMGHINVASVSSKGGTPSLAAPADASRVKTVAFTELLKVNARTGAPSQ